VCCCVKPLATIFILYCSSSLSCMNECIAIYSGGYLCTNSFRALITAWLYASQRDRVCVPVKTRGVKCALDNLDDWYCDI